MTHEYSQEGHGIYEDHGATPDTDPGLDFMRRYRAVGASALSASADLRELTVATWQEVSPKLERLYNDYPSMRLEVRTYMQRADDQFKHLIGLGSGSRGAPADRAGHRLGLALDGNEEAEVDVAVAYAADAVMKSGAIPARGIAIRRQGGNSVFARGDVKKLVAGQLLGDREMLDWQMALELPEKVVAVYGLSRQALRNADNASWYLAGTKQISTVDGVKSQGPPLHMTALVADIINRPGVSLAGGRVRQLSRPQPEFVESNKADGLVKLYKGHLERRYRSDHLAGRMVNVLTECDLAQRAGFLEQTERRGDLQLLFAMRNKEVFRGFDPQQIQDPGARSIVVQCQALVRDRHDS